VPPLCCHSRSVAWNCQFSGIFKECSHNCKQGSYVNPNVGWNYMKVVKVATSHSCLLEFVPVLPTIISHSHWACIDMVDICEFKKSSLRYFLRFITKTFDGHSQFWDRSGRCLLVELHRLLYWHHQESSVMSGRTSDHNWSCAPEQFFCFIGVLVSLSAVCQCFLSVSDPASRPDTLTSADMLPQPQDVCGTGHRLCADSLAIARIERLTRPLIL